MSTNRIDFISAYCDRWCERCAFTERCSAFAVHCAIAMCDDPAEALQLAVGPPLAATPDATPPPPPPWLAEFDNAMPTPEELDQCRREEEARDARIDGMPVMQAAHAYIMLTHHWIGAHDETLTAEADEVLRRALIEPADADRQAVASDARHLRDALEVVAWDHTLLGVKLHRALDGRDRHEREDFEDDHPVQNDWNGSAKVALICIDRSIDAWRVIAAWARVLITPRELADQLCHLRDEIECEFPDARRFVRPGFDEQV